MKHALALFIQESDNGIRATRTHAVEDLGGGLARPGEVVEEGSAAAVWGKEIYERKRTTFGGRRMRENDLLQDWVEEGMKWGLAVDS